MADWTLCFCVRRTAQTREVLHQIGRQVRPVGGFVSAELGSDGYYHVDVTGPVGLREVVAEAVQGLVDARLVLSDEVRSYA